MSIRRTVTAIVSVSALILISAPLATGAPLSAGAGSSWFEGRAGTVKWAIGDEFLQGLADAGATISFCTAAKFSVVSGVNVVTMPAHGNSAMLLNSPDASADGAADCSVTISGNGTSVELTTLYFSVAARSTSVMSADINDEYTTMATGGSAKLPKKPTKNKVAMISPVLTTEAAFLDILRNGPAPSLSSDPVNLGLFQLVLKVKKTTSPMSSGNSES